MADLPYGNPLPPDFVDGNKLTAAEFNAVKNYWVTDELPEDAVDGDVVFVIGDSVVEGELPGLGGWATIESVTGNPTRYEYPAGNPEWVAFEWSVRGTGSVTTTDGILDCLVIAGGGGQNGANRWGSGGNISVGLVDVSAAPHKIKVGAGGASPSSNGSYSYFADYFSVSIRGSGGYGALSSFESGGDGNTSAPVVSSITGSPVNYGAGAGSGSDPFPGVVMPASDRGPGSAKASSTNDSNGGVDGCVIIRVPVENDNTKGAGSTPASVVAAVDQAKETVKQTIKRNRRNR